MKKFSATEARNDFAEILNTVRYGGERIVFHRRGKNIAALISIEELDLIEAMEDRFDLELIKLALKEPEAVPWDKVKEKLGL